MSHKLRTAVIGLGIGQVHVTGFNACPQAELVALCDASERRLAETMAQHGIVRGYSNVQEVLEQPDIDAVSIALPNDLHEPVALAALEAGKHVLCEKPLAINAEAGARMVAAAAAHRRTLMVCFNYRYRPDARWLKEQVQAGAFGDVYMAKAGWLRNSGIPGLGAWFTRKNQSGGGVLIDLGVHMLDMALWLLDYPRVRSVSGATFAQFGPRGLKSFGGRFQGGQTPTFDVEDLATAFIRFEDGRLLQLEVSWASHTRAGRDDYFVTLYGSEAGADLYVANYASHDTVVLHGESAGAMCDTRPTFRTDGRASHALAIDHFVQSILSNTPPESSGEQGLALMRILDAIYESAALGREVTLLKAEG
ncbi:MAG: Gfo/Idh/MocA family oxidoreductase [Chloroflexaceae bacterium]|nr:Gfo/Idh/MocA family oxidoreductase [Chloroflexaceae bacterium]